MCVRISTSIVAVDNKKALFSLFPTCVKMPIVLSNIIYEYYDVTIRDVIMDENEMFDAWGLKPLFPTGEMPEPSVTAFDPLREHCAGIVKRLPRFFGDG